MDDKQTRFTLIQRIRNQMDQSSWEEFTATYSPYINAILYRSGIPYDQVEDVSQDIFVKVWKGIENFEYDPEKCHFRTWLSTVCRNKVYDYWKSKKATSVELDEANLEDKTAEIDEIIEREWKIYIAEKALKNICAKFEAHVVRAYKEFQTGRSVKEISNELGIAENTVHVYSKRVKAAMTREITLLINYLE